ncbi:DUF3987 domain-containing protein [Lysobacter sp. CA199]|uniref:YfjI family protein n=1 Tax=Lysobacter sp. CA199 TaxID=3455608 RepID=UPI003F8D201D
MNSAALLPATVGNNDEAARRAARHLAHGVIAQGYQPTALHAYRLADGAAWAWRMRCDHPQHGKWMRPMRRDGGDFVIGEPDAPASGKPLYLLPELLASDDPVWVVEGERCADALAACGLTVTTSGGADSAQAADWSPLRGRRCILWPDHDTAGQRYADVVAGLLRALGCTVEVVEVAALGLPSKGDCVDWLAAHPSATVDDVAALPRALSTIQGDGVAAAREGWGEPEPLVREVPASASYPADALGPILGDAAHTLHRIVQAPLAICGQSLLAAASLAAQTHADVVIDGRVMPLTVWGLTVADSGERKSAVDAEALRMHREVQRDRVERYKDAHARHLIELEAYDTARAAAKRSKQPDAVRAGLLALGPAPEPPLLPYLLASEPTLEGIHKLLQAGGPALGLFSDEGGQFLGGHAMGRDHATKTAAGLSKLWDGGSVDRIRAGDGATVLYGRRLALHLMVQPVIAEAVLSDPLLTGQGFLARCLLAWPPPMAGTRSYTEADASAEPALQRYGAAVADLLRRPWPLREGQRNELEPRRLPLSAEAKRLWIEGYHTIEAGIADEYAAIKPVASKAAEQVARVAGVLTLIADPDAVQVEATAIRSAAVLIDWHLGEAARLAGSAALSVEVQRAQAVLTWCRERRKAWTCPRELIRLGPNCVREGGAAHEAMAELVRAGWARPADDIELDGRRRRRAWRLHPTVSDDD